MLKRNASAQDGLHGRQSGNHRQNIVRARSLTWAVAGARGGTGKSLIAAYLGADLADRGWQVLLADLDWSGGNLRTLLGGEPTDFNVTDIVEGRGPDTPSALPMVRTGLRLVPGVNGFFDAPTPEVRREMLTLLSKLPCHHLVMDLGAGAAADVTRPFLGVDVPLLVALPDPVGLENTYRFLAGLLRQCVASTLGMNDRPSDARWGVLRKVRSLADLSSRCQSLCDGAPDLIDRVRNDLSGRPIYVVLNQVRRAADLQTANALEQVARRSFGCDMRTVGAIQYDERVWIAARRDRAVAEWGPVTGIGDDLRELVDALLMELGIVTVNRSKGVVLVRQRKTQPTTQHGQARG